MFNRPYRPYCFHGEKKIEWVDLGLFPDGLGKERRKYMCPLCHRTELTGD